MVHHFLASVVCLALTHLQMFYFPKLLMHLSIEETAATARAFEGLLLLPTIQNMNDARKLHVCTIFNARRLESRVLVITFKW